MMVLAGDWWSFVLRGIAGILFGLMLFLWPALGLLTLVLLFGVFAIVEGIFNIIAAFRRNGAAVQRPPWWALLVSGIFSLIAGGIALFIPGITAIALVYLIAGWALATGVTSIVAAVRLRKQIRGEWILALTGALSIVFGIFVAIFPGAGALAIVLWIGAYSIAWGVLLVVLGFRLRAFVKRGIEGRSHGLPPGVATGH